MKIYFEILLLAIALIIFGYLFFYSADILLSPTTKQSPENQVCFGKPFDGLRASCFSVQLAKTSAEQEKGLMFVKQMDENKGMLFIFDSEGIYPFWMKNTLIPLDMIWIDGNYNVVFIAQNAQPCKTLTCTVINPLVKAKYVLEINAGIANRLGIKAGDAAELKITH